MTDPVIPTYTTMLLPTLQALARLGGSATKDELDVEVIEVMGLTDEQVAVEFPDTATQRGSKVIHRLAWARTYLKKMDLVDNSQRGVWSLESSAKRFLESPAEQVAAELRQMDSDLRRQMREDRLQKTEDGPETAESDDDASEDAEHWTDLLLGRLRQMPADAFERLAQRLLREAGFRNVEVLGGSNDGGLDGVGVYRLSLVSFTVFFQCKRYQGSVGPHAVRDFRGAMTGRGEKGLLITTGTFTPEAKKEAARDGAPPVELVDGSALCDLLKEYGLGVRTTVRQVEAVDVDAEYFAEI